MVPPNQRVDPTYKQSFERTNNLNDENNQSKICKSGDTSSYPYPPGYVRDDIYLRGGGYSDTYVTGRKMPYYEQPRYVHRKFTIFLRQIELRNTMWK
jgi:hypothetical protein